MKHIFFILAFALFTPLTAQADYYVWKDAHSDIKLTYPDTWAQTSPYEPDTIVRVEAPGTDMAECKIRVREDRRFLVYPQRYLALLPALSEATQPWPPIARIDTSLADALPRLYVSLRLSALYCQFDAMDPARTTDQVKERLRPILLTATDADARVTIGMELYRYKDLTLRIYKEILEEDEFRD